MSSIPPELGTKELSQDNQDSPWAILAWWPALLWLSWMIVIFCLSTSAGGAEYTQSWIQQTLALAGSGVVQPPTAEVAIAQAAQPFSNGMNVDFLNTIVRKLAHFSEYGILIGLGFGAFRSCLGLAVRRALEVALLLAICYAIADEFHQAFELGRTSLMRDVLIDSAGASIVAVLLWIFQFRSVSL
jgi:VanZ family protein